VLMRVSLMRAVHYTLAVFLDVSRSVISEKDVKGSNLFGRTFGLPER